MAAVPDDAGETVFMDEKKLRGRAGRSKKGEPKRRAPSGTRITLKALDGPLGGTQFRDPGEDVTIGRGDGCAVVLPDDSVSKQHARLQRTPDGWCIKNLSQSNGTFVEGRRIDDMVLASGQKIRIGTTTCQFTETDPRRRRRMVFGVLGVFVGLLVVGGAVKALKPEDPCIKLVSLGMRHLKSGDYDRAEVAFEQALVVSPQNSDARRGMALTKQRRETDTLIVQAREKAEQEEFDAALDLCYEILRVDAKHSEARDLEAVLKAVGEARLAFESHNWVEAIDLIRASQQRFADSAVLSNLLVRAHDEARAEGDLRRAREAVGLARYDTARPLLEGIGKRSCYRAEAVELLAAIDSAVAVDGAVKAAWAAYRAGDLASAGEQVTAGLELDPEHQALRNLRARVEQLKPLAATLREKQGDISGDDVDVLVALRRACAGILEAEEDNANELHIQALRMQSQVQERLIELGRVWQGRADALLAAGRKKEALAMYRRALDADPGNAGVQASSRRLAEEIDAYCRKYMTQGKLHEELLQHDLAIEAYQKVVDAAPEGSEYSRNAKARLQHLQ
jgi:tetratricopeptide (TPR) repeat protein